MKVTQTLTFQETLLMTFCCIFSPHFNPVYFSFPLFLPLHYIVNISPFYSRFFSNSVFKTGTVFHYVSISKVLRHFKTCFLFSICGYIKENTVTNIFTYTYLWTSQIISLGCRKFLEVELVSSSA